MPADYHDGALAGNDANGKRPAIWNRFHAGESSSFSLA
jgi:hypothetical protein